MKWRNEHETKGKENRKIGEEKNEGENTSQLQDSNLRPSTLQPVSLLVELPPPDIIACTINYIANLDLDDLTVAALIPPLSNNEEVVSHLV